ncbi:GNAT family N-acetyltransferase [Nostoc sp. 106C]|uniref:GNAT family N-acetyltransferase n=1 Tax=Nostoc sp. 106C TaxID=1932667 RepID=UPI000A36CB55|nr:GNAT family N-acetyltransferase [Nostoc sp. 106C]OUL30207.1 hypothetical protein BV375_14535 [Nostoc sp. 106C]
MDTEIRIEVIDHKSPHLEAVMALGRTNAKTLGFMPKGGFIDHAAKGHIFIALSPQSKCIGYLMYRVTLQKAIVVHLCVDKEWRGKHIAKQLVKYLINITKHLYLIELSCRRDYKLNDMWAAFGFVARQNKAGNSKDGKLLTVWQLEHGHTNLLTLLTQQEISSKLCAVIDANIFYDLDKDNINRHIEDSKSLLADWLQPDVELCLTDEIYNEIERYDNISRREALRKLASNFTRLNCKQEEFERISQAILKYFPEQMTERDASDLRHLARAIASQSPFFITRDRGILDKEESIYEDFKISILRPSDFIIRLDEIRREADYQPVRLAGTLIERRLVQSGQQNLLTEAFLANTIGEEKVDFQQRLRIFFSEPQRFESVIAWDEKQEPLALIVYDRQKRHELNIPILRVKKNYALSPTILRHLIILSIKISAQENRQFTIITDPYLEDFAIRAISQDNFFHIENGWIKTNLATITTASELSNYLRYLSNNYGEEYKFCLKIADSLSEEDAIQNIQLMTSIERSIYPAKIIDAKIPNFIVPIRPVWAVNLFDEELAKQNIFGAQKELALKREVVYYRKIKNSGGLKAPGRILWYVSQGKQTGYYQVKAIRACSRLDEVIIDTPKSIFRQFRRLGVYSFKDVLSTADNNLENKLMAIRFSDTEMFKTPIYFEEIKEVLGNNFTLQSPYKITEQQFYKLYNKGMFKERR